MSKIKIGPFYHRFMDMCSNNSKLAAFMLFHKLVYFVDKSNIITGSFEDISTKTKTHINQMERDLKYLEKIDAIQIERIPKNNRIYLNAAIVWTGEEENWCIFVDYYEDKKPGMLGKIFL